MKDTPSDIKTFGDENFHETFHAFTGNIGHCLAISLIRELYIVHSPGNKSELCHCAILQNAERCTASVNAQIQSTRERIASAKDETGQSTQSISAEEAKKLVYLQAKAWCAKYQLDELKKVK